MMSACSNNTTNSVNVYNFFKNTPHFYELIVILPLTLSSLAFVSSLLYIVIVLYLLRHGLITSKNYLFLLSRSLGDLMASAAIINLNALVLADRFHTYDSIMDVTVGFIKLGFIMLCCNFFAMTIIQCWAVIKPMLYSTFVTRKHCLYFLIVCWTLSALYAFGATMFRTHWISCDPNCQYLITVGTFVILSSLFMTTMVNYVIIASFSIIISRRRRKLHHQGTSLLGFWKLSVFIGLFVFFSFPLFITSFLAFKDWNNIGLLWILESHFNPCVTTLTKSHFWIILTPRVIFPLRMILDAVISLLIEPKLRRFLFCNPKEDIRQPVNSRYSWDLLNVSKRSNAPSPTLV